MFVSEIEVLGPAADLPLPVFGDLEYPEDMRLKYRFLDLRRERLHKNIMTRGAIIDSIAPPHEGKRLLRIPDADPHRRRRRRARATSWCRAAFIPENSTRCRRRRSSTSSC